MYMYNPVWRGSYWGILVMLDLLILLSVNINLHVHVGNHSSWLVICKFCMTIEELKLLIDICDLITLFYVIVRCKSSEWLASSIESCNMEQAHCHFAFFKHSFLCKNMLSKRLSCLLIFMIQEKEIFISVILNFFPLWTVAEIPLYDPLRRTSFTCNIFGKGLGNS